VEVGTGGRARIGFSRVWRAFAGSLSSTMPLLPTKEESSLHLVHQNFSVLILMLGHRDKITVQFRH
jgi:hypothetical protein